MRLEVSSAWRPENGRSYGIVEVRMADDFVRDDPALWGLVNARGLDRRTTFDVLRVIGRRDWFERFDWLNYGPNARPWTEALGGASGQTNALAGVHAINANLRIKRFEAVGIPGCGILYQGRSPTIESGRCERVGWPIFGHHEPVDGIAPRRASVRSFTSVDHWVGRAWPGVSPTWRAQSLRALDDRVLGAGELVLGESEYELLDYTHHGDGVGWKCSGTQYRIARYHGSTGFLSGVVAANLDTYRDPVLHRHLREARGVLVEDSTFEGSAALRQTNDLLRIAFRFDEPARIMRSTFRRGPNQRYVSQLNTGASAVFEACDLIGWTDAADAFELDRRPGFEASVDATACRYWAS